MVRALSKGAIDGIQAYDNFTLNNSGTISGANDDGIDALSGLTVTNSGTITGKNTGIRTTDNLIVTNSGSIIANYGIAAVNNANVTNSGTITGTVDGIAANNGLTLTNNTGGTITGGFKGIQAFDNLTVNNSGTITGTTYGITAENNLTVTNSGIITGNAGIITNNNANITNSGTIEGTGGTAIDFTSSSGGDTLTLLPGSKINGLVLASAAGGDVLNLAGTGTETLDISQYQGFGVFNKIGSSIWTLTGTNTEAQPWTVSNGTLSVNATMVNADMTVTGGILSGVGTVRNVQINAGGTFAPGTMGTPGAPMTVTGNLAFQSGAQYLVTLNPSTASFANVTGNAALGGATVVASFAPGSYVSKQYMILQAISGLGGTTFNPTVANTNLPSNFHTTLSYDPTHAYLNLLLNFSTPSGGLNINQQNVANTLTDFFNTTGGIPMAFAALTPAQLTQADGELATAAQQTTFSAMSQFTGMMTDRFIAERGDCIGDGYRVSSTGRSGACAGRESYAGFSAEEGSAASSYAAKRSGKASDAYAMFNKAPPRMASFYPSWSVWAGGFGGSQTTDGNAVVGSNEMTSHIAAGAVGADYRFSPSTLAGFSLAGGGTNFSLANNLGSGRSDLFQAGAFVHHNAGASYFTGALAYGWQDVTTNRTVTIAGIDQLQARFNANAYSARAESGYRFAGPVMGITPYAAAQFTAFDLPAYAERALVGSSTFALSYQAKTVTNARSEFGVRTEKSWALPDAILTLRGRLAWAHDYNPDRNIAATFQTLPGTSFVVNGASQAPNSALTTASAEMKWASGWSTSATFEGEFSELTRSYAGKGALRYAW